MLFPYCSNSDYKGGPKNGEMYCTKKKAHDTSISAAFLVAFFDDSALAKCLDTIQEENLVKNQIRPSRV